jgi:hypothetical protein
MRPLLQTCAAIAAVIILSATLFADALIDAARQSAADLAQQLPAYTVTRTSTRTRGLRSVLNYTPEAAVKWKPKPDDLVSDVVTTSGANTIGTRQIFTNIVVNGTRAKEPPAGLSSPTDLATQMLGILAPESYSVFKNKRQELVDARPLWRYDFSITQPYSTWHIDAHDDTGLGSIVHYAPAYGGAIWIDQDTGQVRRTRMQAGKLPDYFPHDIIEIVTNYDLVRIGAEQYLMPIHSDAYTCQHNANLCFKDETIFTNYRKSEGASR